MGARLEDTKAREAIGRLLRKLDSPREGMKEIGEIAYESVLTNFEKGGGPDGAWPKLAESTILQRTRKGKWPGKILVRAGAAGGLLGSIHYQAFDDKVVLAANKVYAAIHHHGGKAGRGRSVDIPARPFMAVRREAWREMKASLEEWLLE